MTQNSTHPNFKDLFFYPFGDSDWKRKLVIASVITFFGIVVPLIIPIIFLAGYCERIMRRIIQEGEGPFLPEWDDWGSLFANGAGLFGAGLIYSLPGIVLFVAGYGLMMSVPFTAEYMEASSNSSPDTFDLFFLAGMFGGMALFGVGMLAGIVTGIMTPPALAHSVAAGKFSAAFRVQEWWPIFRANLTGFLLSYVILMGTGFAATFIMQFLYLTLVLCCLVPFAWSATAAFVMIVSSAMFAQAYREGVQNLASKSADSDSAA
jgi:predicted anti-sigma-YlaC factor YlaD